MLYPLSYGRTVSAVFHAQIEHLIRCSEPRNAETAVYGQHLIET
jgi:hypothetical protein